MAKSSVALPQSREESSASGGDRGNARDLGMEQAVPWRKLADVNP